MWYLKFLATLLITSIASGAQYALNLDYDGFVPLKIICNKHAKAVASISCDFISKLFMPVVSEMTNTYLENKGWISMDSSERISAYCIDLVDLTNKGLIEEITERDNETNQAINILCTGDNPCFVGESGVGKSAIVQNLALKIAKGEVPEKLKDKKIWLLDFSKLMASGNSSEDYITKIRNLVGKLKNNRDNILFFDEVQRIAPIADYFKTEMAKGSSEGGITIIGATTPNEYNSTIAKDPALVRRFSLIKVTESSKEETKKILNGVKQSVSEEFGVVVKDECIDEIIRLSEKYKKSDYFPAKAIKLLNQTASFCKNSNKNVVNKQSVMEYMSMSLNIPVEEMAKD